MHHGEGVRKVGRLTAIKQRKRYDYGFQYWDDTPTLREHLVIALVLLTIICVPVLFTLLLGGR